MTFKDRFLWKPGDLEFSEPCRAPTPEEKTKANRAITETIEYFALRQSQRKSE
jgi:hypothetical protein